MRDPPIQAQPAVRACQTAPGLCRIPSASHTGYHAHTHHKHSHIVARSYRYSLYLSEADISGPGSKNPNRDFVSTSQLRIEGHSHRVLDRLVETKSCRVLICSNLHTVQYGNAVYRHFCVLCVFHLYYFITAVVNLRTKFSLICTVEWCGK